MFRNLSQSQKIRMQLGGNPDPFEPFPEKSRGMHQLTYLGLRARAGGRRGDFILDAARDAAGVLREQVDVDRTGFDVARPPRDCRNTKTAFVTKPFSLRNGLYPASGTHRSTWRYPWSR
jgi:hypothetical protein